MSSHCTFSLSFFACFIALCVKFCIGCKSNGNHGYWLKNVLDNWYQFDTEIEITSWYHIRIDVRQNTANTCFHRKSVKMIWLCNFNAESQCTPWSRSFKYNKYDFIQSAYSGRLWWVWTLRSISQSSVLHISEARIVGTLILIGKSVVNLNVLIYSKAVKFMWNSQYCYYLLTYLVKAG